ESPSALNTETSPLLSSPPPHLVNNPIFQATLDAGKDYIQVETLFNVDKFESMLWDYSNQPFIKLVMRGLYKGFWLFDRGDWPLNNEEYLYNYASTEQDLEAIWIFKDKEIKAGHWSKVLTLKDLLLGMKASPLFVVWQKNKAYIVTDHLASGLNDGIFKSEAQVRYNNMHTFGQAIYNAEQKFSDDILVLWKSDVASVCF
ncbi:hypothetical protein C0995_000548, partial [Termitomyces sp. Mi166